MPVRGLIPEKLRDSEIDTRHDGGNGLGDGHGGCDPAGAREQELTQRPIDCEDT